MFDLCGPMKGCATPQERHLFMEGDLRYKDSTSKVRLFRFSLFPSTAHRKIVCEIAKRQNTNYISESKNRIFASKVDIRGAIRY